VDGGIQIFLCDGRDDVVVKLKFGGDWTAGAPVIIDTKNNVAPAEIRNSSDVARQVRTGLMFGQIDPGFVFHIQAFHGRVDQF
jgi:hypothetical protein